MEVPEEKTASLILDSRGNGLSQLGSRDMNNKDINRGGQNTDEDHLIRAGASFRSRESMNDIHLEGNVLKSIST